MTCNLGFEQFLDIYYYNICFACINWFFSLNQKYSISGYFNTILRHNTSAIVEKENDGITETTHVSEESDEHHDNDDDSDDECDDKGDEDDNECDDKGDEDDDERDDKDDDKELPPLRKRLRSVKVIDLNAYVV